MRRRGEMHRYQELVIERVQMYCPNWEYIRYPVEAWIMYTQDVLDYIDNIKPVGRAIDVGCGYGTMAAYLADIGWKDVVAVDIDPLPHIPFLERYGVEFIQADIERDTIHIPEFTFDLVVFTETLEHLGHNPWEAMHKLKWLTSIGGTIILSTPDIKNNRWKGGGQLQKLNKLKHYTQIQCDSIGDIDTHYYHYSIEEIQAMMDALGFATIKLEITNEHIYYVGRRRK